MADFPTIVTTNGDPTSANTLANAPHAEEHQSHNAEIKATQTKIGIGASTPTAGKVLRASGTGTSAWAQVDPSTDVTTMTSATLRSLLTDETGTGAAVFGTAPTLSSPVITTPSITTSINDSSGNEVIKTPATASATNEITVTNAANGSAPVISATGSSDTNVDLRSTGKGTGKAYSDSVTEFGFDFVVSGLVWSGDAYASTLNGSMTAGFAYISGVRVTVAAVTAHAFTASKDTYIYLDNTGTITYNSQTNNAASPAMAANNILIGIVVSGAGNIAASTSINQGQESRILPIASSIPYQVTDSLGNLICPRDPQRRILGYRQRTASDFTTTNTSATQITELSVPIIIPAGRKYEAFMTGEIIYHSVNNTAADSTIWEGTVGSGTQLAKSRGFQGGGSGSVTHKTYCPVRTPSSTSITINGGLHAESAGTATAGASSTAPLALVVKLL